ncbi:hypothetical protein CXB51_028873 [Gossypium anomalum]|uniref:Integrase catalytic domain-containing protein n=1 Tax=Gossypium anomalum TaxID=47600 RepID=A0A8J6CL46_9ROSI|nr:hypothetical protein CXB51_028873 [Gossypium anomalum]
MPHEKEAIEDVALEEGKEVKIGMRIAKDTRQGLIELLHEFKDIFAWSYQDMPGLNTNIVVHRLPIRQDCKPVQQKLRRMRPDIVLKIKDEVRKQFDVGFLQEVKYSEWVANIVPVPKKDRKIKMHPEDMDKTTFITLWGTHCYKEIEGYVDDMIAKSRTEEEHIEVLRKLFLRLRKFQLKLNPAKCTFGARLGKLLGFVVSEKGIEVDSDKVKAIRDLPPPHTQKEVRGFLGRLNYFARFISQLTEKCDPIFRLLRKHNQGTWDEECQNVFDKVKQYLLNAPVLSPPSPGRPLILYLLVFSNSIGCVLGQHDRSGRKEKAIYYLSKKFTECEMTIEKLCCALIWTTRRALEDYEPLNFDFPNEELICVATTEDYPWKLSFDGASNAVGNGIVAVLVSPNGDYYPFTCKLDFDCTNNMAEYKACIMGLREAIEQGIRTLEVYGDSALVVLGLLEEFDDITFNYIPRDENQMADALATLASNKEEEMRPIQMSIFKAPACCYNVEEEKKDNNPWYQDILRYVRDRKYPEQATENDKQTLRCVDAVEAKLILEEVHKGVCGTHTNGFTMARQIMRFGYYWSTMEGDCINYTKKCHKCQFYGDKIHVPPSPLHVMTSPWPFSMWGMDVIGPISPKASNRHRFIFVVIDYFTKWVEATSYANVTKSAVSRFLKKEIFCRYGTPERIISDNALNLNNKMIAEVCSQFKIKHHNSSPYHPKMNGAVEAVKKNIKKIVGKMTETYRDWHEKLSFALLAYRTSIRTSTGATPFSLVYGIEAVLPIEVEIPSLRILSEIKLDELEWIQSRYDQLNLIEEKRLKAIHHGQMYQKRMMRAYDKKVRPREFHEGDLVLKKILPIQKV